MTKSVGLAVALVFCASTELIALSGVALASTSSVSFERPASASISHRQFAAPTDCKGVGSGGVDHEGGKCTGKIPPLHPGFVHNGPSPIESGRA